MDLEVSVGLLQYLTKTNFKIKIHNCLLDAVFAYQNNN